MADMGKCDQKALDKSEYAIMGAGGNARPIEAFVKCAAERTGVRRDWRYADSRARVLALGDAEKARHGLRNYAPQVQVG